jgi:signal transduction histidine kinase
MANAGSQATIGLLLANQANQGLLRRKLAPYYAITMLTHLTKGSYRSIQLLIIDGVRFAQYRSWIVAMRKWGNAHEMPVLLLSPRTRIQNTFIGLNPDVDAVVHTPMALTELLERIVSLLATRVLARHNASLLGEARAHITQLKDERDLRERVVSALGHDLRTPLTSARLHVERIVRGRLDLAAAQILGQRVVRNIDRCDRMIRSLLDVSRMSAGEPLIFDFHSTDLCTLVRDMLNEMSPSEAERFIVVQPEFLIAVVNADGIRRTLENLLSNAVKYGTPGVAVTLTLQESTNRELAVLKVHNQGDPIAAKDMPKLFESFSRASNTLGDDMGRSWGLGLGVVKGIVQAHNGYVEVESVAVSGTTFTVTLPKARSTHLVAHGRAPDG